MTFNSVWQQLSNVNVTGTLYSGTLDKSIEESFFIKQFDAYIAPSKHTLRAVNSPPTGNTDYLTVTQDEGVQINMSRENFERICKRLHASYEDELLRTLDEESLNLYMRYKTYVELKK